MGVYHSNYYVVNFEGVAVAKSITHKKHGHTPHKAGSQDEENEPWSEVVRILGRSIWLDQSGKGYIMHVMAWHELQLCGPGGHVSWQVLALETRSF